MLAAMSDSELIDKAGGTTAVARVCGVTPAVVTNWKSRGIPMGWRKFLAVALPEVFATERAAA